MVGSGCPSNLAAEGQESNAEQLARSAQFLERGAWAEAREALLKVQNPIPAEGEYQRVLESRLAMEEGRLGEAAAGFSERLESRVPVPPEVFIGALLGSAEVLERQGDSPGAARKLLQFLKSGRELPDATPVFQKLAAIMGESQDPPEADLRDCTRQGPVAHQALARFYLAQFYFNVGRGEKGAVELAAFCKTYTVHPLRSAAFLRRAEHAMDLALWEDAERFLAEGLAGCQDPELAELLELRQALTAFYKGAYKTALERFERVREHFPKGRLSEVAFNSGLAAVRMGDLRRATAELQLLRATGGTGDIAAELELEIALLRVSSGQAQAEESLQTFLKNHPRHPRLGDARVALAELYNAQAGAASVDAGPRSARALRDRASGLLLAVAGDPQSPQSTVQARYLAVFLADAAEPRNEAEVIQLGEEFLKDFPASSLGAEVRMKLGEGYFRRRDCANAEFQFASLEQQWPQSPLAETALFLAGQCAASLLNPGSVDRALAYWDKVAGGSGPLRWKARYQQASVKSRIGEEAEGVVLFDLILKAPAGVLPELRLAARCGKADALLALVKRTASSTEEALREYQLLAEAAEASPVWRNQALYKIGKTLEPVDSKAAMEAFEKVLSAPGTVEAGEFFWSYKAGFDAARIQENKAAWREAVALYERLAAIPGARSGEARARAQQLRLERFLWE
ncbi:MAG: TolA-binding protein [Verrucomicrobia bacterium]|nr:MAG: TolA-binding protein [Verrucomicrobiota bacterium]